METENYKENVDFNSIDCLEIGQTIEISNETSISDVDIDYSQNLTSEEIQNQEVKQELANDDIEQKEELVNLPVKKNTVLRNYTLVQEPPVFASSSEVGSFDVPPNNVMSKNTTVGRPRVNSVPYLMPPYWQTVMFPQRAQSSNYLIPPNFIGVPIHQRHPHPYAQNSLNIFKSREEVLKKAKSVFSKRTRNLYHWYYPGVSKHQIKKIVASKWDAMNDEEKRYYICQVIGTPSNLVKHSNPMINPQLEHMHQFPNKLPKSNAEELRDAISSIMSESDIVKHTPIQPVKRGRGRPRLSTQVRVVPKEEFEDDPELNRELAQFTSTFNNHF